MHHSEPVSETVSHQNNASAVSVGYSIWTNYSFKQPLLFASLICLVGNLLVTIAYDWGGLPLLFLGRLLTGTGAARALNRRYIADFVSVEGRTTASIWFVAASSAGMAAGPFAAVPLSALFDKYADTWRVLGWSVNAITVSGWLMVAMWLAFYFVAQVFFQEPLQSDAEARDAHAQEQDDERPQHQSVGNLFAEHEDEEDENAEGRDDPSHEELQGAAQGLQARAAPPRTCFVYLLRAAQAICR